MMPEDFPVASPRALRSWRTQGAHPWSGAAPRRTRACPKADCILVALIRRKRRKGCGSAETLRAQHGLRRDRVPGSPKMKGPS